jgi:hypothetical protein
MRYRSIATLSAAAATLLWLSSFPASLAAQRGHGGPPPSVQANHPTPPAGHGRSDQSGRDQNASATTTSGSPSTFVSRIERNPQLTSRLTALLPSGMSLDQAAQGFKNQGQFIAALHVSHNLAIPFDTLKTEMTGSNHRSLGDAIAALKPGADADKEVKTAETEAKDDVKATDGQ